MDLIRTIHHFDDQPEYVRWICNAVRNRYGVLHPEWLDSGGVDATDDWTSHFKLKIRREEWTIAHRVYESAEQFVAEFPAHARLGDVAFIDLMVGDEEDASEYAGTMLYDEATKRLGPERVYFLTAYPKYLESLGRYRGAQLIIKPPDVTKLIGAIISQFDFPEYP